MKSFSLNHFLNPVYTQFPEAPAQPVIGITANYSNPDATLRDRYYKMVVKAGGTPVIIPPVSDPAAIVNTLNRIDALLLTGGADHNPLWSGEQPTPLLGHINRERDLPELLITRLAYNRQIPMLGICRGIQTLAIALGGKVEQNIKSAIKHSQDADREEPTHTVGYEPESILAGIYGNANNNTLYVNSFHHQAVKDAGAHLMVIAKSTDGVIEAVQSNEFKQILGVQWHPEWLGDDGLPIFKWLVDSAAEFQHVKDVHHRLLTLDTHCDTPMFFPQGVDFTHRDSRILYDLHKMTDGRTDAVTMVAYLPQPKMGEQFSAKIDLDGIARHNPELAARYHLEPDAQGMRTLAPNAYADMIFDKIEDIVSHNDRYLSIARTPQDLYEDKRNGRKSIMLGIENGLALNHDLSNIKHFAQRGIVYITLCHNGDNDICDSARGCNTHNGVSQFGEKVIMEMNRLGIMVDLSHAAEKSFYDALDISAVPIVCSHSNSKALCNVPRNLTDDQMRALAAKGGVAHITLYHGFLRQQGEATILDAIAHLEHAISVMGIEHVGIGTDFDGDGGVRGLADASELMQFTLQLLRRHYSEHDLALIWGGNWLRVMSEVKNYRV